MNKIIKLLFLLTIASDAVAAERNPFAPVVEDSPKPAVKAVDALKEPLISRPVREYNIVATAVSPKDGLAVVKTKNNQEYFVYVGDKLGSEGGEIEEISFEGVKVNVDGKVVSLKTGKKLDNQEEKKADEAQ